MNSDIMKLKNEILEQKEKNMNISYKYENVEKLKAELESNISKMTR